MVIRPYWRETDIRLWGKKHKALRVGKRLKTDALVDSMCIKRSQYPTAQTLMLRVFESITHHRPRQSLPSVRFVYEYIGNPGKGRLIGDDTHIPDLLPIFVGSYDERGAMRCLFYLFS